MHVLSTIKHWLNWWQSSKMSMLVNMTMVGVLGVACYGTPVQALDQEELTTIGVYERALPAVVTVMVQTSTGPSSGTGFLVSDSGVLVTSCHVIGQSQWVKVVLSDKRVFQGKVIAKSSSGTDLALLKLTTTEVMPYLKTIPFERVRVGQKVYAIGNPYGFDRTLTNGIVSRLDPNKHRIQTDASINPGSSGGPLLNSDGDVIGISQSIYNPDGDQSNIGIGFAVPTDEVQSYLNLLSQATPVAKSAWSSNGLSAPSEQPKTLSVKWQSDPASNQASF